uniref:AMMECR1 domain-containing protein n=1 Tax=Chromera velia CCMP2878 TaxID=1169474 RepID=A0A0G4G970_9ALVE|mmetsp:Transcript_18174/g.36865  ORF Transcript_18174/g.36865 Transcript_18174/m.36865 type:complete len:218 (+) Transcript_18174:816-1469(+)|eukprot:Cvel_20815.t1-p1 / transcript=Cvel_20815.t1 / gene=Cvel_20815 / organism=Chromera_velia_CCMP2878 / gene_product=Uncharacterized protein CG5902, putative / transcript_product=Uncharacterized protein CG5902, putative / location=Cvel_scaffold1903:4363-8851(+) / protein_length=217 / sequence_SO=supercontig / SO=protein_coding / is_pseudo=false
MTAQAQGALEATSAMCGFCFDVLDAELAQREGAEGSPSRGALPVCLQAYVSKGYSFPMFITWKIRKGRHEHLRGCIGTLSPAPAERMGHYALQAALSDSRFKPVYRDELPSLSCKISILHSYEKCEHPFDWTVGVHGVLIEFSDPQTGQQRTATYLPEVALEHGMTKEVALTQLVEKAGYRGRVTDSLIKSLKVTRYRSSAASMTHAEWLGAVPLGG